MGKKEYKDAGQLKEFEDEFGKNQMEELYLTYLLIYGDCIWRVMNQTLPVMKCGNKIGYFYFQSGKQSLYSVTTPGFKQ